MQASPTVALRGVSLRRPGTLVLRRVDLILEPGEALAVFGGNGSGKTTLLRVLATLLPPTAGEGTVLGTPLGSAAAEGVRDRIGLVGHEPALYPNLTLGENLRLLATLARGAEGAALAAEALATVGLAAAADRQAARSSNGMRRRAEFARMLIVSPELLLLDEAHVGLDPAAWALVTHLVSQVTGRGGAAVVVAHERERVRPIVTRAVELMDGTLHEVAS